MASQQEIAHETNVRFWISTQYKIGDALSPADPTDRMHAKFWLDIYRDLARQNALGTLTLTYKDPSFAQSLNEAITASRIERSLREDDPRYAEARRARAQAVNDAALWQEIIMSRRTAALSGMLAARHTGTCVGGIFGDIGHALSSAANTVGGALKTLKTPVALAAGAAATAFGGPAAGPIAAQLTGALIDAAPGGHPAAQAAAQQTVAAAQQAAKTNPTVQTALDAAHHATSQATVAALGSTPAVSATPNTLSAAVQKFLPLATQAVTGSGGGDVGLSADLQSALSTFGSMLGGGGVAVSGWYDIVGGSAIDDLRERARGYATVARGNAAGVIQTVDGRFSGRGFPSLDAAIDWLQRSTSRRGDFIYAAAYEKASDGSAFIQDEEFGAVRMF